VYKANPATLFDLVICIHIQIDYIILLWQSTSPSFTDMSLDCVYILSGSMLNTSLSQVSEGLIQPVAGLAGRAPVRHVSQSCQTPQSREQLCVLGDRDLMGASRGAVALSVMGWKPHNRQLQGLAQRPTAG